MLDWHPDLPTVFIDMDGKKSNKLSRFRSSEDLDYKKIIERMQSSLVFKTCISESLTTLLDQCVNYKFPLDSTEYRGRTPLHWAASAPNPKAVEILIREERALVNVEANDKQTPLHRAVIYAAKVKDSERDLREKFKDIIEKLIEYSLRIDAMDKNKKTAWDYAKGEDDAWNEELIKLSDTVRWIPGPSKIGRERSDARREPNDEQMKALLALKAFLVEVFPGQDKEDYLDFLTPTEPSVYDLIYSIQPPGGLENILYAWRPKSVLGRTATCRWVHLPANNVRASSSSDKRVH